MAVPSGVNTNTTNANVAHYGQQQASRTGERALPAGKSRREHMKPHLNAFDVTISHEGIAALTGEGMPAGPDRPFELLNERRENPFMITRANSRYRQVMEAP